MLRSQRQTFLGSPSETAAAPSYTAGTGPWGRLHHAASSLHSSRGHSDKEVFGAPAEPRPEGGLGRATWAPQGGLGVWWPPPPPGEAAAATAAATTVTEAWRGLAARAPRTGAS